ncbi:unnamed protein product [Mytilus coruscus]|uniref:B box-type domain-containing protein n=1 Tax=Mytilus coruscus TaxID=42192 RepID=A0A6J8C5I7_MYTCO|nr:unnamed protein product [Mytilus coruscus]
MATNWSICGVCDNLQITKKSVVWCFECDEGLSGECKNHHAVSKASKSHETVSIAEYKKLPTEVLQIAQTCTLHNEKFELFCRKYDSPCCNKCVKSHNDCKKNKKRDIEAEIKQTKINVNHHLDKFQDDLINELVRVEQNEKNKIEKLLTTLKKKEKEITEVQENIASIKQHASELQTFLTIKDIEKDIAGEEKFIQSITTSDSTNQVNISCQINKSLQQITASVHKFGEINVSSDPCDFFHSETEGQTSPDYGSSSNQKYRKSDSDITETYQYKVVRCLWLFTASWEKGLQMISLNVETITNVNNIKLPELAYVTTFCDKLFYTNYNNDSVTWCDYHSNVLWTFRNKSVLLTPVGISVDNDGHVFVAGCVTDNVVVVSPDGQRYKQLLSSKDGLVVPWALHYDTSTNGLLVENIFSKAFLYDVK